METTFKEYKRFTIKPGKVQMTKNEYLNLIKQSKKLPQSKNKTLYQSLRVYYKDDKNILPSKEIEPPKKIFNMSYNNESKKDIKKTPHKIIKKISLKGNFANKLKGKIIYKNSRNESSNLYNNKIIKKENSKENIFYSKNSINNNNDKENLTTSTTSPFTTPVKENKEKDKRDNHILNNLYFSGDNIRKSTNLFDRNKIKYTINFDNNNNNFIFNSRPEVNTIQYSHRNQNNFNNIFNKEESPLSNRTYSPYINTYNYSENTNYNINTINRINVSKINRVNSNKSINNDSNNNNNNINNIKNNNDLDLLLNVEDLIMIEDKFSKLLKNVNDENINVVNKSCYEWWNFYFNCTLKGNCDYLFLDSRNKNIITCHNSLLLISIMLVYDLSFNSKVFLKLIEYIKKILYLNHQNFLNICQYLISRIKQEFLYSKWVEQLKEMISSQIEHKKFYFNELDQNLQSLNQFLSILISNLNTSNTILNPKIKTIYKNFMKYNSDTINNIFMSDILKIDNQGGSLLFSSQKFNNPIINDFILKKKPIKPLTLVLDLDETLMSFVYITKEKKEGLLRLRPFLYNFLNLVKEYYEIIIFTAATISYANPILDAIEIEKGKYFNFRLYRNHCSIVNNEIVKDINFLGRDISKIIIVDNMQQNFKLQKENGILISSFWGEDSNDKALLHLGRILVSIATDMISLNYICDIRDEIKKYKDDILKNVSMS